LAGCRLSANAKRSATGAKGEEEAAKLRAETEKQRTIILASAEQQAQRLRGEADAAATQIYAQAHGKNPEFYSFVRSLQAYEEFVGKRSTLLLSADSYDLPLLGRLTAGRS